MLKGKENLAQDAPRDENRTLEPSETIIQPGRRREVGIDLAHDRLIGFFKFIAS